MASEEQDLEMELPARDEAIETALRNRLDLAQALQDRNDTRRGIRIARKQMQPDIAIVGRYQWSDEGPDWDDAWALDEENWTVSLVTDSDLLLREEREGVRRAMLDDRAAELRVTDVEALIRRQVDQAMSDMRRAENELMLAGQNLELARQRANLSQRLFEKGRIDNTQATDAEIELQQANTQMLNARAEMVIARYRLLRIMGTLIDAPDELKPAAQQG
jgi:outer membrane protein TolC